MGDERVPPGWPDVVRPAGAPGWERTAVTWLLDQCPADYRAYPALRNQPVALAWLALRHVTAQGQANAAARSAARAELREHLTPDALEGVLVALDREHARLLGVHRGVRLVGEALQGLRYVPRL
ncbi:hypothetical protein [Angustibacter sp. Root456]|uniref:hypothetical protein n=1 Tax=Angustibacter sp. Root456 TaxID=1736539 RepID=UPI00070158E3|nr:hypothetical protein [Angustibacter sp. Root456]KQX66785.1 hypothetical protein ASD06_05540 [Angustibacter sp. Root456]